MKESTRKFVKQNFVKNQKGQLMLHVKENADIKKRLKKMTPQNQKRMIKTMMKHLDEETRELKSRLRKLEKDTKRFNKME